MIPNYHVILEASIRLVLIVAGQRFLGRGTLSLDIVLSLLILSRIVGVATMEKFL
jgi:hypothetical protein